ncbi:MAG: zinc ribbon domain-containing protein, partial [Brooklawnia sp.]|jgi:predicted  nucleic acid-binding Zn-ribbon protein
MQADPSAQRALLLIADLETRMAQLRHRKQRLPEHAQLAELAARRAELAEQLVASQTRLGDAQTEQDRIESDLEPARARLERNQGTIDAGAADAKVLQSLIEETRHLRGRISDLEDAQLDSMQAIEDETAVHDGVAARKAELEQGIRELLANRDAAIGDLDGQIGNLDLQRSQLAAGLPADVVALYDRIAARTNGTGAAECRARRCTGCGLELDVSVLKRLANAAPSELLRCEECGRILVRTDQSGL